MPAVSGGAQVVYHKSLRSRLCVTSAETKVVSSKRGAQVVYHKSLRPRLCVTSAETKAVCRER